MEIRPDRVAIYIRWSTEDQGEGTTLEVQREGCTHYLLSQGWQVREDLIFVDDGYSGGTLRRPGLTALRKAVQAGQVDCVVVFKLDRLSRSVLDTVNLVLDEWEGRCHLKSAREPIETLTPAGKLFFYMLLSYAEWERTVIKDRTFSGKVRRAREGRVPGRCPYGYRPGPQPGMVVPEPAAAVVVRRIFTLYDGGMGLLPIARLLNREGIPSPGGGRWQRSTVAYILRNPLYKGEVAFLRVSRNPRRERDPSQPYYIRNPTPVRVPAVAEPLVDPDLWERVQARLSARGRREVPSRALASPHLLTGLLRCRCGAALTGAVRRGVRYYVCGAVRERGAEACPAAWVRQEPVDRAVVAAVLARYGGPAWRMEFLPALRDAAARECAVAEAERQALRDRLRSLRSEAGRVDRAFRAGDLPASLYRENRAALDREAAALRRRLKATAARLRTARAPGPDLGRRFRELDPWQTLTRPQQKEVLRALISRVSVWQERGTGRVEVEITWRGGNPAAGVLFPPGPGTGSMG